MASTAELRCNIQNELRLIVAAAKLDIYRLHVNQLIAAVKAGNNEVVDEYIERLEAVDMELQNRALNLHS